MDASDWAQILGTGAIVSLVSGGLQVWSNRNNLKAGTTQILTDAAGEFTETIMGRLKYLETKDKQRDKDDHKRDVLLARHATWDRKVVRQLNQALPDLEIAEPPPLYLDMVEDTQPAKEDPT